MKPISKNQNFEKFSCGKIMGSSIFVYDWLLETKQNKIKKKPLSKRVFWNEFWLPYSSLRYCLHVLRVGPV